MYRQPRIYKGHTVEKQNGKLTPKFLSNLHCFVDATRCSTVSAKVRVFPSRTDLITSQYCWKAQIRAACPNLDYETHPGLKCHPEQAPCPEACHSLPVPENTLSCVPCPPPFAECYCLTSLTPLGQILSILRHFLFKRYGERLSVKLIWDVP